MIADIQAPDLETRIAILNTKAREKNYGIPTEVLNFIAEIIQSNIRELEGALNRLMVFCELNGATPTVELAKNILATAKIIQEKLSCSRNKRLLFFELLPG